MPKTPLSRGLLVATLTISSLAWAEARAGVLDLRTVLNGARPARGQRGSFEVPQADQIAAMEVLVAGLARRALTSKGESLEKLGRRAQALGLEIVAAAADGQRFLVLREPDGVRRGSGIYAFRRGKTRAPLIIEAPHTLFDTWTDVMSRECFIGSSAFALFQNTVERYTLPNQASDLAHTETSLFHAAHRAACAALAGVRMIQLHGFSGHSDVPSGVDFIVSDGGRTPPPSEAQRRVCAVLESGYGADAVGVYGEEVFVLGGTTNLQGVYLNRQGRGSYIHLECSKRIREGVAKNPQQRNRFTALLAKIVKMSWTGGSAGRGR